MVARMTRFPSNNAQSSAISHIAEDGACKFHKAEAFTGAGRLDITYDAGGSLTRTPKKSYEVVLGHKYRGISDEKGFCDMTLLSKRRLCLLLIIPYD